MANLSMITPVKFNATHIYINIFLLPRIDIFHMRKGYGHAMRLNHLSATLILRYLDVWDIENGQLIS